MISVKYLKARRLPACRWLCLLLLVLTACRSGGEAIVPATREHSPPPASPTLARSATTGVLPGETVPPAAPTLAPATPFPTLDPGQLTSELGAIAPLASTLPPGFKADPRASFASYRPGAAQIQPRVSAPAIAADLSNVELRVLLAPEQRALLARNGFVVSPSQTKEFFTIYEQARYEYVPVFVTSDSLLHVYHLLFDKTLRQAEINGFIPILSQLDWALLRASLQQYEQLKQTDWADAARRNAAYFALPIKLLNPDWPIPEGLRELVEPDLAAILAHAGLGVSKILPHYKVDWGQYKPRGHYTSDERLSRYFRAMIWHGQMTFEAREQLATRQAALLVLALRDASVEGATAEALWSAIYEPTVFFVGKSDDLLPMQYRQTLEQSYGQVSQPQELLDETKFKLFQQALLQLPPPQINYFPEDEEMVQPGLRFMGQRFVLDAFVFDRLMDPAIKGRVLPKALDFFAALGSQRALAHLRQSGATDYPGYDQQLAELRQGFELYDEPTWTQNLYWSWIYSLKPLLEPVGTGYPQFMRSEAWLDKQLNTSLASWSELKRDTILYAKQAGFAEMGAGNLPPPLPEPPKGYVEPVPLFYDRIAALSRMTVEGLDGRGLLAEPDKRALEAMVDIAERLRTIAEKELRGEALSEEEYEFIRFYGAEIEALTFGANDSIEYQGRGVTPGGELDPAAVVADVATGETTVLEEGVGHIFEIYVVAPIDGQLVLAKGGVFSHYEFEQPFTNRLSDEEWRAMLDSGDVPPLASWTSSYLVPQKVEQPVEALIRHFNISELVNALWLNDPSRVSSTLVGAELEDTAAYIEENKRLEQFVGIRLLSLNFRSFDFQDQDHATVTTRERWSDELYSGSAHFADDKEAMLIGVREPYESNVTYTLVRQDGRWLISKIVISPALPEWQER